MKADGSSPTTTQIGTVDLLRFLLTKYGERSQFSMVLGTDSYNDLVAGKWRQSDVLLELLHKLYVVVRPGIEDGVAKGGPGLVEAPALHPISSTKVREALAAASESEVFLNESLHPKVLAYIDRHGLYGYRAASRRRWAVGITCAVVAGVGVALAAHFILGSEKEISRNHEG